MDKYAELSQHHTARILYLITYDYTYSYHKMLYLQILPLPTTVDDSINYMAHTPYNRPESAFNFKGWQ